MKSVYVIVVCIPKTGSKVQGPVVFLLPDLEKQSAQHRAVPVTKNPADDSSQLMNLSKVNSETSEDLEVRQASVTSEKLS